MSIFNIPPALLNAINKVLLQEHELTRREVVAVNSKYGPQIEKHKEEANKISGHLFGSNDRLVIPIENTEHPTKTAVESHLRNVGYTDIDYRGAKVKDRYGRDISIGKALARSGASQQLMNDFAAHQQTYAKQPDTSNLQVVISKHPHDVIGMSHGTNWGLRPNEEAIGEQPTQSCMKFDTYQHDQHMPYELNSGTHVAWLTHKDDDEAKEPLARITLRPYDRDIPKLGEPKFKQFKINVSKDSQLYKTAIDCNPDDPSEHIAMGIHYAIEDYHIPHGDNHYGTFPHEDERYRSTFISEFKHPITHSQFKQFVRGFADNADVSMYGIDTQPLGEPEKHITDNIDRTPHTVLIPGKKMYGEQSDQFKSTVQNWANRNFKPKENSTYNARKGIYLDGDPSAINT